MYDVIAFLGSVTFRAIFAVLYLKFELDGEK
jgi:hypothetical protein